MRPPVERVLSRAETHDLNMIIKERTKVLRFYAEEQGAKRMADFEQHMATVYKWDQDEVWQQVTEQAGKIVLEAQKKIEEQAKKLGIPSQFVPGLELNWRSRGQNMAQNRRTELRRVAKTQIDAMLAQAIRKVEKQGLDLRQQVVAMGLLSPDAKTFLESMAPIEEAMCELDFKKVELQYLEEKNRRASGGYLTYED